MPRRQRGRNEDDNENAPTMTVGGGDDGVTTMRMVTEKEEGKAKEKGNG
jgi:hypothetical protein